MKNFIAVLTTGDLVQTISRYSDMVLAGLVVIILGMLIIPIPTFLLDLFIVLNMSISVLLLLLAIYIPNALHIASFPSLLLITTLFRLALNVSSTRLILLTAKAGEVIAAFGDFVVQGNLVVGIVVFLILTLINFLVITKGAERVAEVAARFTLDAMPGKQMSIDADLRAGAFDMDEARKKRNDLSRESQLFGSMDGAMKFVKGDSIAGLIITAINIVAGVIIGTTMLDMTAGNALEVFAILTIGDGLVSQIPALLIAITAGLIVTRVASEEEEQHLGKDIAIQLLAQPRAFLIAAALMMLLGAVPGLPTVPFFVLGCTSLGIGYGLVRSAKMKAEGRIMPVDENVPVSDEQVREQRDKRIQAQKMQEGQSQQMLPVVTPIALEVSADLIPLVEDAGEGSKFLGEMVPMMRDGLFYELGVRFPGIRVRGNETDMPAGSYLIMINEIPLVMGTVSLDKVLVNDTAERLRLLNIEGETATNPANGNECAWIDAEYKEVAEQAGLTTWDAAGYIVLHLSSVLRKNAAEFVGIQEVMNMLEQLEQAFRGAPERLCALSGQRAAWPVPADRHPPALGGRGDLDSRPAVDPPVPRRVGPSRARHGHADRVRALRAQALHQPQVHPRSEHADRVPARSADRGDRALLDSAHLVRQLPGPRAGDHAGDLERGAYRGRLIAAHRTEPGHPDDDGDPALLP